MMIIPGSFMAGRCFFFFFCLLFFTRDHSLFCLVQDISVGCRCWILFRFHFLPVHCLLYYNICRQVYLCSLGYIISLAQNKTLSPNVTITWPKHALGGVQLWTWRPLCYYIIYYWHFLFFADVADDYIHISAALVSLADEENTPIRK